MVYTMGATKQHCILCNLGCFSWNKENKTSGEAAKAAVDTLNSLARFSYNKNFFAAVIIRLSLQE